MIQTHTNIYTQKVKNYAKYRPIYPAEIITFLNKEIHLNPNIIIADIGSGTGIFSKVLLENGNLVYGIEPNEKMRKEAEHYLNKYSAFQSIGGTAEDTGLSSACVDLVTVAQAFHWFNLKEAKKEIKRILKPFQPVVLIWNERQKTGSPFQISYESLLNELCPNYINIKLYDESLELFLKEFFSPNIYNTKVFSKLDKLNFEELKGRLLSSSYAPSEESTEFQSILKELHLLFEKHQIDGLVNMNYETYLIYGKVHD